LYSKIPTDPGVLKIRHSHRLYIFLIPFVHQGYNWSDLIETGKLSKLKVKELDEYLDETSTSICWQETGQIEEDHRRFLSQK